MTPTQQIDDYISKQPEKTRELLEKMRVTIQKAAPKAEEAWSYQMPTFKLHGNLVHFLAYKNHIGFYPAASGISAFQEEIDAKYVNAKGSVQFPIDKPIPVGLVTKIVKFRVKENLELESARQLAKGKKKK